MRLKHNSQQYTVVSVQRQQCHYLGPPPLPLPPRRTPFHDRIQNNFLRLMSSDVPVRRFQCIDVEVRNVVTAHRAPKKMFLFCSHNVANQVWRTQVESAFSVCALHGFSALWFKCCSIRTSLACARALTRSYNSKYSTYNLITFAKTIFLPSLDTKVDDFQMFYFTCRQNAWLASSPSRIARISRVASALRFMQFSANNVLEMAWRRIQNAIQTV